MAPADRGVRTTWVGKVIAAGRTKADAGRALGTGSAESRRPEEAGAGDHRLLAGRHGKPDPDQPPFEGNNDHIRVSADAQVVGPVSVAQGQVYWSSKAGVGLKFSCSRHELSGDTTSTCSGTDTIRTSVGVGWSAPISKG